MRIFNLVWKGLVQIMRKKKLIQQAFLSYAELEMKKIPDDLQIDQSVTPQFEQNLEKHLQQQDAQKQFKHLQQRRIWKASITTAVMFCIVLGAYMYQRKNDRYGEILGIYTSSEEETNIDKSTNEISETEQVDQETGGAEQTNSGVEMENSSIGEGNDFWEMPERVDGESLVQEYDGLQGESLVEFAVNIGIPIIKENRYNVGYSPSALYDVLKILSGGAEKETKQELLNLLAQSETTLEEGELDGTSAENTAGISSALWIAQTYNGEEININPEFIANVSQKADIYQVDFGMHPIEQMNQWLKSQQDILPNLEVEIEPDSQIYILNTIDLEMKWNHSFDPTQNTLESFIREDGTEEICEFMNQVQVSRILEGEIYWASSLEMDNGSMFFVLPKENATIQEICQSSSQLNEIINKMLCQEGQRKNVTWKIPKFFYKNSISARNALISNGLEHIFTNESQLGGISDQPLSLTQLLQTVSIELNEYGVNSSSASETAIQENGLESEEMFLNRPFFYGIEQNGRFVFLGICENPLRS